MPLDLLWKKENHPAVDYVVRYLLQWIPAAPQHFFAVPGYSSDAFRFKI
jgi:hypothetical protein